MSIALLTLSPIHFVFANMFSQIARSVYQDDELIKNRDFQAPLESAVDVSLLPKVMQKRNFGKMSQTKVSSFLSVDGGLCKG